MQTGAIDRIDTTLSFHSLWILRAPQQARVAQSDQWLAASSRDSWNGVDNLLDLAAVTHFFFWPGCGAASSWPRLGNSRCSTFINSFPTTINAHSFFVSNFNSNDHSHPYNMVHFLYPLLSQFAVVDSHSYSITVMCYTLD